MTDDHPAGGELHLGGFDAVEPLELGLDLLDAAGAGKFIGPQGGVFQRSRITHGVDSYLIGNRWVVFSVIMGAAVAGDHVVDIFEVVHVAFDEL
jgi:hypothetical protein